VTQGGGNSENISPVTMAAAVRARHRAETELPTPDALAGMAIGAAKGADMSPAQIRHLAATAIDQAQQISYLLGKLAGLLDGDREGGPR
jgi:hypothetical protein